MAKKKNPGGQPTKYNAEVMIPLIDKMGNEGESKAEMALALGISKQTFYTYMNDYPKFLDAVKGAQLRSQVWWEKKGREAVFSGVGAGFSATCYIFNMKNRFNDDWKDQQEVKQTNFNVEISGDDAAL